MLIDEFVADIYVDEINVLLNWLLDVLTRVVVSEVFVKVPTIVVVLE
jgi:hypothetical protein